MADAPQKSLGDWYAGWQPNSPEHKRHVWEMFEMALPGELDESEVQFHWHWTMFPMLDLFGPALVYSVGLQALGYPPTFVDMKEEADLVEAALLNHVQKEYGL